MTFEIKGQTIVKNAANELGVTSADDMIKVEEQIHNIDINTSGSGPDIPEAVINTGRSFLITVPLTKKDDTLIDALIKAQGATTYGQLGDLGAQLVLFALQLLPATSGSIQRTFPTCYIVDSQRFEGWSVGGEHKRILTFRAIPDPTALQTATTPIMTFGAV